jgi:hydrogenase expression/formation protein HypE
MKNKVVKNKETSKEDAIDNAVLQLGHGSGGLMTADLIDSFAGPGFQLGEMDDAAVIETDEGGFAFTTDSFVVEPIFFPGGDIGRLAVFGTVNDLAAQGAEPAWISLAVVGAEGFPMAELREIIKSVNSAAVEAGVVVVTGDTKVVERGGLKGLILNTAGLGRLRSSAPISASRVEPGDALVVSGPIGEHEAAVLCHRYGFGLDSVSSDCCSVASAAGAVMNKLGEKLKWMRDPTRGGLATVLNELSRQRRAEIEIVETQVPISGPVTDAADILGLDPYYLACEGRLVFVVAPDAVEAALKALRDEGGCPEAREIGRVIQTGADHPLVVLRTELGGRRVLRHLAADQQPRIC